MNYWIKYPERPIYHHPGFSDLMDKVDKRLEKLHRSYSRKRFSIGGRNFRHLSLTRYKSRMIVTVEKNGHKKRLRYSGKANFK
jgi:hypothetical protein